MKRALPLVILSIFAAAPIAGCVANDDGDHVTFVTEYEPDDTLATATHMGSKGVYAIYGECIGTSADVADCFSADAAGGVVSTTLYVSETEPGNDGSNPGFTAQAPVLGLSIVDAANTVLTEDPAVSSSHAANLHTSVITGKVSIRVKCDPSKNLWYSGVVHIP